MPPGWAVQSEDVWLLCAAPGRACGQPACDNRPRMNRFDANDRSFDEMAAMVPLCRNVCELVCVVVIWSAAVPDPLGLSGHAPVPLRPVTPRPAVRRCLPSCCG